MPLASLQQRLNERDLEIGALSSVIARQGRSLQQYSESSIDEALKRKDKLMAANQTSMAANQKAVAFFAPRRR